MKRLGKIISLAVLAVVFCSVLAYSQAPLLKSPDVHRIMKELLMMHVQKHEITPEILQRSLKVYINRFDPERVYLLESEVDPYLNPSEDFLSKIEAQYYNEDFSVYQELQDLFQKGIERSRRLRAKLLDRGDLFEAIEEVQLPESVDNANQLPAFPESEIALEERMELLLRGYIKSQKMRIASELTERKKNRILALYNKRARDYENQHLFISEKGDLLPARDQEDFIVLNILKALAKSLDAHTAFFSPSEAYDMKMRLEKGFFGLGIVLEEGIDGVNIVRVIEDGPAGKTGNVFAKDRIIGVAGQSVIDYPFQTVLELIRGRKGTVVELQLQRDVEKEGKILEETLFVDVERGKVVLNEERVDVEHERFGDGIIGVIELHSFYEGNGITSERDVKEALVELKSKGDLKGLVLDLRENTGGFLQQAVKVGGLFISNGVVVVSKYADEGIHYYRDMDGLSYFDGPIVVLISKISASAAEIVAQALQDYGVALVVGSEHSWGKGSIQHQTITGGEEAAFFKVTVGQYYTPSGKSTQLTGVESDVVIPGLYSSLDIGEKFSEYPLQADTVAAAYNDSLQDIDPVIRRWFQKYYLPTLQPRTEKWRSMLPRLSENSAERQENNADYQLFLKDVKRLSSNESIEKKSTENVSGAVRDLQLAEAVNVVKDMIHLDAVHLVKATPMPQLVNHETDQE